MSAWLTAALVNRRDPFSDLSGVHVLIVDDNEDMRTLYTDVLMYCGAVVSCAASALDALRLLQFVIPDVVVTDLEMPAHSGEWLLRRVRQQLGYRIPMLLLTASATFSAAAARRAGFDDYLEKPTDLKEFCEAVARLARRGNAEVRRAS